jgi:hypothetical protein
MGPDPVHACSANDGYHVHTSTSDFVFLTYVLLLSLPGLLCCPDSCQDQYP